MPIDINYNERYQLFYLKKALNELLSTFSKEEETKITNTIELKEDHNNGCNYINNIKIPVTFPLYVKDYIFKLEKKKSLDYFYMGTITGTKEWVNKYIKNNNSIIKKSDRGRTKMKYELDENYYKLMSQAKFTLCATEWGERKNSWTYRFFEAIMCLSIPILQENSNDIYLKEYFCYYDNDKHIYDEKKAIENYKKFINSKHFLQNNKLSILN